jgi:hypothetical protein
MYLLHVDCAVRDCLSAHGICCLVYAALLSGMRVLVHSIWRMDHITVMTLLQL